jgi:hypothetical protein
MVSEKFRHQLRKESQQWQTEGLISVGGVDKWAKGETTARNEERYILQMQQGKIDYKTDGINNIKYELITINTATGYNIEHVFYLTR